MVPGDVILHPGRLMAKQSLFWQDLPWGRPIICPSLLLPPDDAQASPTCLTGEFEGSCSDWTNSDMSDEHMLPAATCGCPMVQRSMFWRRKGAVHECMLFLSVVLETQPPTLTPGNTHVFDFAMDQSRDKVALLIEDSTHLAEIFVGSTSAPGELRRITSFNDALLGELTLSTPEYLPYTGEEGWPMDGWVLKPPDFDPAKKYPLICGNSWRPKHSVWLWLLS